MSKEGASEPTARTLDGALSNSTALPQLSSVMFSVPVLVPVLAGRLPDPAGLLQPVAKAKTTAGIASIQGLILFIDQCSVHCRPSISTGFRHQSGQQT